MSNNFDLQFIAMCQKILSEGWNDQDVSVRTKWKDGTPAHTIKTFGVCNTYDLQKEFPISTLRPLNFKGCVDEMLWIFQKKSNNLKDLNSRIWDSWAVNEYDYSLIWVKPITLDVPLNSRYWYVFDNKYFYSKQSFAEYLSKYINKKILHPSGRCSEKLINLYIKLYTESGELTLIDPKKSNANGEYPRFKLEVNRTIGKSYGYQLGRKIDFLEGRMDQIDWILKSLETNPYNRRMITNLFNHDDLKDMPLYPCAWSVSLSASNGGLNMILNQRSQDVLVANCWNVTGYAILLVMFAIHANLKPGKLLHVIADAHIYDRHVETVENLISLQPYCAPKLIVNPDVKNFYDFKVEDFQLENYKHYNQIKNLEVAV